MIIYVYIHGYFMVPFHSLYSIFLAPQVLVSSFGPLAPSTAAGLLRLQQNIFIFTRHRFALIWTCAPATFAAII